MLTPEEQAELDALENELRPQRMPATPNRKPGDLQSLHIQVLSPEEEAELNSLEQEFGGREFNQQPQGMMDTLGNVVTSIGETVDSYTGAPSRSAVDAIVSGKNPISAFANQFGENPNQAPTGKEIAEKVGFDNSTGQVYTNPKTGITSTREKSDADIMGFGIDLGADITNLLPFAGAAAKNLGKGAKWALRGSANAADVAAGTKFVKAGEVAADTAKIAAESAKESKKSLLKLFRPEVSPDFKEYKVIAQENGIPEGLLNEAHEFGDNSIISRNARSIAEGPLGGEKLEKHKQLIDAVTNATENKIKSIGGVEKVPDNADAGALILDGFDEGVDNFFKGMGETYNSALAIAPDMKLNQGSSKILSGKLNEMEMWAKKRIGSTKAQEKILDSAKSSKKQVTGATNEMLSVLDSTNKAITPEQIAQAKEVLEGVKLAKNALATSGGDLRQVYSAMRDIGEVAFKKKKNLSAIPSDQKKFQEMYFSLQKGMTESIRGHLGDDFADALIKNNSAMSDHFSKRSVLEKVLGDTSQGSGKIFDKLIMKGDTKQIESLFSILSPEKANQVKAAFLNNVVSRNSDGIVNFKTTRNNLNELRKSGKLKALFTSEQLADLDKVLKLGEGAGNPILSTSGTGASGAFKNMAETFRNKVENDVFVEGLKRGARKRANYVEVPNTASSGKSSSGFQMLKEKTSNVKNMGSSAARAAQEKSVQERNEKIKKLKQIRGLL